MADALTSITGISSGIDSKALVEQMMALERRPAVRLQATIDANAARSSALGQFQTALDALKTASAALADGTAFDAYSVTTAGVATSGRALLSATAGAGAVPGAYQVKVLGLATTHKQTASIGQASASAALGVTGSFELRRPDDTVLGSVTLDGTESLSAIRDKINAFTGTAKLAATIVSAAADGSDQRLVLSSQQTGSAGRFKLVTTDAPAGDPLAALGLDAPIEQLGKDAQVDIDGVVVTRSTNTLTDVLQGVTLTLSAEDQNATATVTVDRFKNTPRDAVKGFVEAYNKVRAFITQQSAAGAPLASEAMVRSARGSLSNTVLAKGAGLPADLATLASVGVSLAKDGSLTFDATKFDAAYSGRYDELKATLANRAKAVSDFAESLSKPVTGAIDQREMALTDHTLRLTDRIADIDARLEKKRAALLAHFAKFEATLGGITAMGNAITAQLKGLNASSDD
jgi:flagellar hook-associated protein 2